MNAVLHDRRLVVTWGVVYVAVAAVLNGDIAANGGTFGEQLVITIVAGLISAGGVILGAWLSTRESRAARRQAAENKRILQAQTDMLNEHTEQLRAIEQRSKRRRSGDR